MKYIESSGLTITSYMPHFQYISPKGISAANRRLLTSLHGRAKGPFTATEAAAILEVGLPRARRLLSYLWQRGWLTRIRRGLYTLVPLDAARPSEWQEEPWLVASKAFEPCYIGGWSACEHWHFTDQIFRGVAVVSARKVRERSIQIQDTTFIIKTRSRDKLFGTSKVWLHGIAVEVSDAPRTIVDILDDPKFGGGIRHVADVLAAYLASDSRDDSRLLEYIRRLGNRAAYKRLGYLLEVLSIPAAELTDVCFARKSKGLSLLDPSIASAGRIVSRWNLRVNAKIDRSEP